MMSSAPGLIYEIVSFPENKAIKLKFKTMIQERLL